MNPMFEDRRIRALLLCSARFPLSQLPESVRHIILFTGSSDLALQSHQYEPRAWQGVVTEWMVTPAPWSPHCACAPDPSMLPPIPNP